MEMKNQSSVTEFILVGLSSLPEYQMFLFILFTFIYMAALTGNLLIVITITTSTRLYTPMYFLLINLSLINLLSISVSIPKMLHNLLEHKKTIAFLDCITQIYLFTWTLGSEALVLAAMAFDRYVAVCHPLHYTIIMRKEVCVELITGVWIAGVINSAVNTGFVLQLSFCNSNIINHFFCELPSVLKLSCSDISLNETLAFLADIVFGMGNTVPPFLLTLISYVCIISTILRIPSTTGKHKAFSTCSSHLIVVTLFYGTLITVYMLPSTGAVKVPNKVFSVFYTVLTPLINPLIYSLRNKKVKEALKRVLQKCRVFPGSQRN
uniref:Olfactory receptor n=1 Tax=Gopherus evgoodei TaxID=1825980 RepID=A0A8C4WMT1_9SAUR